MPQVGASLPGFFYCSPVTLHSSNTVVAHKVRLLLLYHSCILHAAALASFKGGAAKASPFLLLLPPVFVPFRVYACVLQLLESPRQSCATASPFVKRSVRCRSLDPSHLHSSPLWSPPAATGTSIPRASVCLGRYSTHVLRPRLIFVHHHRLQDHLWRFRDDGVICGLCGVQGSRCLSVPPMLHHS